jgi:hypothetical protein
MSIATVEVIADSSEVCSLVKKFEEDDVLEAEVSNFMMC